MAPDTDPMRLSQGHLNCWESCPRKFQQIYLDQMATAPSPEQQGRIDWGNRFHLLLQQRELGLPIEPFLTADKELGDCLSGLLQAAPEVFLQGGGDQPDLLPASQAENPPDPDYLKTDQSADQRSVPTHLFRQSEYRLTLPFQGYLLTAVYDLLVLDGQTAKIFDWKTYPRPQKQDTLAQNWQTRLYLFLLAKKTDYSPEQISMTYWFVRGRQAAEGESEIPPQPQKLTFTYSTAQHEQTRQDLNHHLDQLTTGLTHYQQGDSLPHLHATDGRCPVCDVDLDPQKSHPIAKLPDLSEIPEVTLE